MFRELRYQMELARRYNALGEAESRLEEAMTRARNSGAKKEELDRVYFENVVDVDFARENLAILRHKRLCERARQLSIPVPQFDLPYNDDIVCTENWERTPISATPVLSERALHKLRAELREETTNRREIWFPWVPMAVSVVALVISLVK